MPNAGVPQMNKSHVCNRPGWTAGRVEKFLTVEYAQQRRGFYGEYTEYEYSLPQVLEAEKSPDWRKAAAKYLQVSVDDLDATIVLLLAKREATRIAAEAHFAALSAELKAKHEAEEAERKRLVSIVRGGCCRIGCIHPLSDGWRTFTVAEVLKYVDFADRRGRIDGEYIREFYGLWSEGAGYCNPKGVLRRLIGPVKNRLVRILVYRARREGWVYGVGTDDHAERVLYIDTPRGQVSFHLMRFEGTDYPNYTGAWSGDRNSDKILIQLFDSLRDVSGAGRDHDCRGQKPRL